ncbi:hypothetical protein BKA57DRAFT_219325 [Linnemannia elongata]|nr:hypothetical protein BKA57DRAFT_219325 [Linnemannia elongata]
MLLGAANKNKKKSMGKWEVVRGHSSLFSAFLLSLRKKPFLHLLLFGRMASQSTPPLPFNAYNSYFPAPHTPALLSILTRIPTKRPVLTSSLLTRTLIQLDLSLSLSLTHVFHISSIKKNGVERLQKQNKKPFSFQMYHHAPFSLSFHQCHRISRRR